MCYYNIVYLTRDIYVRHNSGDLNDLGTKIWGFFSRKPPYIVPQIKSLRYTIINLERL